MPINLLASYIIGGMLLLTLGWTNFSVSQNSNEVVISQNKQEARVQISEIITYDFPKIGYVAGGGLDTLISKASDNEIVFYSNIDNSSDGSIETIKWEFTSNELSKTENPNDYQLVRTINGEATAINLGVTSFKLTYYEQSGSQTPMPTPIAPEDLARIGQIEVELILESSERISENRGVAGDYIKSAWVKRFTPRNLFINV